MNLIKVLENNNHLVLELDKDYSPNNNLIFWGTNRCDVIYNKDLDSIKFINTSYNLGTLNYVQIFSDETGQTRMGPLLGMLISSSKKERILQGYKDNVYIKLTDYMSNIGGILVFFTINDVDWNRLLINGHILYTGNYNAYVPVCIPLPRVIYDRCFGSNGRLEGINFREKTSGLDIKIFNAMVKLGKLETYDTLSKDSELQKITLPYSEFSINKLIQFMEQYDSVYVKPDQLFKGEGLIKVTQNSNGYCIEHHRDKVFTKVATGDLKYVLSLMEDFGELSQKYVIQKSIDLSLFLGNPIDVRVMLQKNDLGDWEVTGALARVGPEDCLITSPRSGGKVIRLWDALSSAFPGKPDKQKHIIDSIEQYAKNIGCLLEKKYRLIGELGIDLGVDKQGNIWLIEVNAKPLRVSMKMLKSKPVDSKINSYPCLFGAFLDGFSLNNKEIGKTTDVCKHILKLTEISSLPRLTISVGKSQIDLLNINPDKPVLLKIGSKEVIARVQTNESQLLNQIGISPDIMREIGCYSDIQINLISSCNNIIWLGPLLAVMTPITYAKSGVEDKEIEYMEKISYDLGCLLFHFTVQDINWSDKKMLGSFFNREKSIWEEKWFPLPDVVYDLSTFPRKDLRKRAKEIIKQLNKRGTVLVNNRRYFGKYETIEAMSFLGQTKDLIPETHELTRQNLYNLFQNYTRVYVKSEYGSRGDEVIRIDKVNEGFKCEVGSKKHETVTFTDFESMLQFASDKYNNTPAVVQQGIKLSYYEGRVYDLRVVVQKDENSAWQVNLVSMRLAPCGSTITNISIGGKEIVLPQHEIERYIPQLKLENLIDFSKKCALAVECSFGSQGVLGLDVGIDGEGKLWLLEVNSKPCILDYLDLCNAQDAYNFYVSPVKYGLYLVKQNVDTVCKKLLYKYELNRENPTVL